MSAVDQSKKRQHAERVPKAGISRSTHFKLDSQPHREECQAVEEEDLGDER